MTAKKTLLTVFLTAFNNYETKQRSCLMKKILCVLIGLLIITYSTVSADSFRIISAEELKKMSDAKKQIAIVDTRTEQEFRQGHIPKAINIPPEKVNVIASLLPKSKKTAIVFYCRGAG